MGGTYKEVCWHDKILEEVSQLLPLRCLTDDIWEQSQDTTTNTEISHDSVEVNLKPHNISSIENQDSILITNTTVQHTENINVCVKSPFHADYIENAEESFNLLGGSLKKRSGDTSIENSPKRMNLDSTCKEEVTNTTSLKKISVSECATISSEKKFHIAPVELLTSDNNFEECQVVPTTLSLSSETIINENPLELHKSYDNRGKLSKYDNATMVDTIESDKVISKPRQASVDSVLDSGIGDSCNSIDSTEKFDITELKNRRLERHCWHSKVQKSLTTRLPGIYLCFIYLYIYTYIYYIYHNKSQYFFVNNTNINKIIIFFIENSYYRLAPGRYIFPGAEIYFEPEDYDQYSLSANSESTGSDNDSFSGEEEEDEEEIC
jgi:NAD-dependent deacetylase sirtuin 1